MADMTTITAATPWTSVNDNFAFLMPEADLASFSKHFGDPAGLVTKLRNPMGANLNDPEINAGMVAVIRRALVGGGMSEDAAYAKGNAIVNHGAGGLYGARDIVIRILNAALDAAA